MNINELYKLKSLFVTREVGDELILVPLSGNVSEMDHIFTINETGKLVWENLRPEENIDFYVKLIMDYYEVEKDRAYNDVNLFLSRLSQLGDNS
jgi:hypothetical protein